jgi:outer membrane protein assembly factor BamB/L-amino acid N-acyltransferase YncA
MTIRPARDCDLDAIWEIFQAVIVAGDTYLFASDTPREVARDYFFGPEIESWVVEDEGRVRGMYKLIPNRPDRGAHVANASFMVHPDAHGRGLGRAMGEHCLEQARRAGYLAMQFNFVVSTNTAGVALWKKLGFTIVGTLPKAFNHKTLGLVDAYVMHRFLALVISIALLGGAVSAQDWSQWRGPARDGSIPSAIAPKSWPASLSRAWRIAVGEGYSSPVVAGGRVFVHSRRDPEEFVVAVDLATGKQLWQQKYNAPFAKNQYAVSMAKGPHSTPLASADRLYTLGVTGVLSAWNPATGALLWRNDYSASVDTSKLFTGTAMSPALEGGALIVQVGSDVHGGRVLALDPATGKERWAWRGEGPGYASPAVFTVAGTRQIATFTNNSLVGIDAETGKLLWSTLFPDEWHENIVTPIWTGTHLLVSGTRQGTHAYALSHAAGAWKATQAWKNADVTMYLSTPVYADGVLYGLSIKRKGQFVALDAKTGAVKWATEGREGNHASILLAPAHVLFLTNGADLVVARRDASKFVEEKRYTVADSEIWSMPAVLPDGVIIRDSTGLTRLQW